MDRDTELGLDALRTFHNRASYYAGYGLTFDEFLARYGKKAMIYAEGIGLAIRVNGLSSTQVRAAMEGLAAEGQGRIPSDHNAFIKALGNEAQKIDWIDLTTTVAGETAVKVAGGFQALGDSLITSMSVLNFLLPLALVGGVIFIYQAKVKRLAK